MADTPQPDHKSGFGFLTRKIGPVPIWLIAVGLVGAYYWYKHYGPGATAPAAAAAPRPEIIEVKGQRGARGYRGPRGYRGRGEASGTVPNVVGEKWPQASRRVQAAGYRAQRAGPYVGTVRSEFPPAGSHPEKGSTVTLRGKPWPYPQRGQAAPVAAPEPAVAPMTAGDIYGTTPTATPAGDTYDSGQAATAIGAAYAVAG